jgi:predicted transglutaminase-like cysteine proteinase
MRVFSSIWRVARRLTLIIIVAAVCSYLSWAAADPFAFSSPALERIERTYGEAARARVVRWRELVTRLKNESEQSKLDAVNGFFNELDFVSDIAHWGREDYWATPVEFLGTNGGDCEDFSVAKYFTLRELGVPDERMSLTYVKSLTLDQAHMVVTYFPQPGAEPLVLDNIDKQIRHASARRDLLPIYSFNGENLWLAKERGRGQLVGNSDRLGRWRGLNERMRGQVMNAAN